MNRRLAALAAAALLPAAALTAACGDSSASGRSDGIQVSAAFYPLAYLAEQVGGDHVDVSLLTKPGTEPHDLELTPKEVASLSDADLVLYESGFQPAVDDAVDAEARDTSFDVAPAAHLDLVVSEDGREHAEGSGAADGTPDPHFWLDPTRFADVGSAVAAELRRVDPDHAAEYTAGAERFDKTMSTLDRDFRSGLTHCASTDLVTSHEAFGYLAQAYGLTQRGISGLSPDTEPSAAQIASITDFVDEHGVTTIYAETLVSPKTAETVARETGATVAVLDPIEGITDESKGSDYLQVMRSNLATLETGQGCS
jgi:zinc transport system substrate-binding protein